MLLKFYFKYENGTLPAPLQNFRIPKNSDMHTYSTRYRNRLSTPVYKHVYFRKSVHYALVPFINSLPTGIRDKKKTHSLDNVVQRYKFFCIDNYNMDCTEKDCYVCLLDKHA